MRGGPPDKTPPKERLARMPTHAGAVWIGLIGLFGGLLVAQVAVRLLDIQGAFALIIELVVLGFFVAGVWGALPDRFFNPWTGFYDGKEVEPWVDPADRDDGRPRRPDGDDPR